MSINPSTFAKASASTQISVPVVNDGAVMTDSPA